MSGIRAACFPCSTSLGATFDVDLLFKVGHAVAREAITKSANVLLAPTLNVIRSPLGDYMQALFENLTPTDLSCVQGGRNYETYSEDPILLGHLAAAYVNGEIPNAIGRRHGL